MSDRSYLHSQHLHSQHLPASCRALTCHVALPPLSRADARKRIVYFLFANIIFQYIHQTLHFVYHTYQNSMKVGPGALLLPATMIASAGNLRVISEP